MKQPVRILIVDDSAFMRLTLGKHLESDPAITVVGKAHDGLDAVSEVLRVSDEDIEPPPSIVTTTGGDGSSRNEFITGITKVADGASDPGRLLSCST